MAERYLYFEVKIPFDSIKTFSAALHLLHKLGRDCTIEVEQSSLTLRSLNDSKTAFGSVEFQDHYFDSFSVNETKSFSCKLALKPVCIIIRNVKNVRFITMSASRTGAEHELSFQMNLANGITRTHRLIYSDCEIMNALFEEEGCSQVKSRPGVFCQLLDHLHRSPEVCVQATPTLFTVSSYHKAGAVSGSMTIQQQKAELQRHMATGISVNIIEFDLYQFRPVTQWDTSNNDDGTEQQQGQQQQEELIFCTKEVNSFLGFCEALDLPSFDYFFTCGGRASKYACRLDGVSVSLILATIVSDRLRIQQQQYQQAPSGSGAASRSASAAAASAASVRNGKSSSSSSSSKSKVTSHKVRKEVEQEEDNEEEQELAALPPPRGKSSSSSSSGAGAGAGGRNSKQSASSSSSSSTSATAAAVPNNSSTATVNANGANIFENADEMKEALKLQQMFDEQKKQAAKRSNTTSSTTSSSSVGGRNKTGKTGKSSSSSKRDSTGDISGRGNFLADAAKKNKRSNKGQEDEEEEAEFDEPLPAPLAVRLNSLTTNNNKKEAAVTPVRAKKGSRKSIVEEDTEEQEEQEEDSAPISMGLRSASREAAAAVSYVNRYIKTEQGLGAEEEEQEEWTQRNEETQQLVNDNNNGTSTVVPKTVPAASTYTTTSTTAGASAKKSSSSRETGEKSRKSRKKRLFEDSEEDD